MGKREAAGECASVIFLSWGGLLGSIMVCYGAVADEIAGYAAIARLKFFEECTTRARGFMGFCVGRKKSEVLY